MKELAKSLLFGRAESTVIYECHRCGTDVSPSAVTCPCCGCDTISEYRIE